MLIGIDFDNTIVCYDALFHKVALERGLIPADLPVNKSEVRNFLRRAGKEEIWTEMQGAVYGGRMAEAAPYPGVIDFFLACRAAGIQVRIISHKTRYPFLGEKHDLHQAARGWLELQGFFDPAKIGLQREDAFFELTKQEKLQRIATCGCTHFIDDLPEILSEPSFPQSAAKILFDPADIYPSEKFTRYGSWLDIRHSFGLNKPAAPCAELRPRISRFVAQYGIRDGFEIELVRGGGNNRVYQICSEGKSFALKEYFQNPADPRDRFGAERAFYDFIAQHKIPAAPERFGWEMTQRLGLFSFVEGRKLAREEIHATQVRMAARFISDLNRHREAALDAHLPIASEACFSFQEHLECVDRRIARLDKIEGDGDINREALAFIRNELAPAWTRIRASIAQSAGSHLATKISQAERCLSPSDFGFHNALALPDQSLRFFDFEYAGWDDPAKLVCDFFCQPQIPVRLEFWDLFLESLTGPLQGGLSFAIRARTLLPAYQVKWCCIMLNEFFRHDQARRDFARGSASNLTDQRQTQLQKARQALQQIERSSR